MKLTTDMRSIYSKIAIIPAALILFSSCLSDDEKLENDYSEWKLANAEYIDKAKDETIGGVKRYEQYVPAWDKSTYILMQWHNDRSATAGGLTPLDNSTVDVKYLLTNIEGDTIDSSYKNTVNGDSIFRCKPNEMITGFQAALTNMHVGDTVTTIIPYTAGYGTAGYGNVLPFSTLIFNIKLVDIKAWEKPPHRE